MVYFYSNHLINIKTFWKSEYNLLRLMVLEVEKKKMRTTVNNWNIKTQIDFAKCF